MRWRSAFRTRLPLTGLRGRLLLRYVALLALATIVSVVLVRAIVFERVQERIQESLDQEVQELRVFIERDEPPPGESPEERAHRVFDEFLRSDIPERGEVSLTFIDGEPASRSRELAASYRLDRDPALVELWGELTEPTRGTVETPAGPVDFVGVPAFADPNINANFVVAIFRTIEDQEVDQVTLAALGVGLIVMFIGAVLAARVARRALVPVEAVTHTARSISDTDLSQRIEVEGDDEIARLAHTFNAMLDRLEHAFNTQREFINDAGHELRTPITIVTGHLDVLDDDPEERARTVALLMDELERMARMVDDLLVLTVADRPDFLSLQTVDVAALTEELSRKMRALAKRRWAVDESGRGWVVGDRQRLTQAIMQLIQNAVGHTEQGDEIALGSSVDEERVRFWVRDGGTGVAPEDRRRIFERFARGKGSSGRSEGAGLGLAIVKVIAEAHHGQVTLGSELGKGSKFTIEMPLDQPADQLKSKSHR